MKKLKKNANNNDYQRKRTAVTTMTTTVASNTRNSEARRVNTTNTISSVMDISRRSTSESRIQVSKFQRFFEDPTSYQHFPYFYTPSTLPRPSHCSMPSFSHSLDHFPSLPYSPAIPIYLLNFSNPRTSLPYIPYHADPLFQRQPEGAEASSPSLQPDPFLWPSSFWVSPQRCPFPRCDCGKGHNSGTLQPRLLQPFPRAIRLEEDVSRTRRKFNDCYASSSTMLYFGPTYDLTSRNQHTPIFHVPLKPETEMDEQQSLMYQNFPPPPRIRYNLNPPHSMSVVEENPLGNLINILQADLAPKRPSFLWEDIESETDTTSSTSSVCHPENHPERISLGHLHYSSPQKRMSKHLHQTQEYNSSNSVEENTDTDTDTDSKCFVDVESIEN